MMERTPADNNVLEAEAVVSLNYLSNFWRFLNFSLINCEIELVLSWSKECIISEISIHLQWLEIHMLIHLFILRQQYKQLVQHFKSVVTLSINDTIKYLENIKQRLKRTISWNKYWSEIATQPKNKNLGHLINPTFRNINSKMVMMILREIYLINITYHW